MNKRNTVQRAIVLETVKELRGHATADEVYSNIIKKHPDISRGTVYRNLNLLSDLGEIKKIEIPGGADRYDYMCHDHYHVKCLKCGHIFDVDMDFISDLEKRIKNTQGFQFISHDVIFKGICIECNTKEATKQNEQA